MTENRTTGVRIAGIGMHVPQIIATNDDFAKIVETSDEWITQRTGIKQRHITNGEPTYYLGAKAAQKALDDAGIKAEDVGMIIAATVTADYYTPSVACLIQREIGAIGSMAIDINCACAGFVYGFDMAKRYLQTDHSLKYVLLVAAEELSKFVDYTDRTTCVLFGDGASAFVLKRSENTFFSSFLGADGNGAQYLAARGLLSDNPFRINEEELDMDMPHQANIRRIETAAKNLGVPMQKFPMYIDKYGNTSSASIPIAFCEAVKEGRICKGDKVCFVGFGGGLTYGAVIFEY